MISRKKIGVITVVLLMGCAVAGVWLFYGTPVESGRYSDEKGIYWMEASATEITLVKDGIPFATLKNTTRVWPVVDSEDEKCLKYVIRVSDDGEVKIVRKENPPFDRKEFVFKREIR